MRGGHLPGDAARVALRWRGLHSHCSSSIRHVAHTSTAVAATPADAQAVAANAQAALCRASRLRGNSPLAPPPACGLFDLDPQAAGFGAYAALEAGSAAQAQAPSAAGGSEAVPAERKKRRKR